MYQGNSTRRATPSSYDFLPPEPRRPMPPARQTSDIVDAEYELVISPTPSRAQFNDNRADSRTANRTWPTRIRPVCAWIVRQAEHLLFALSRRAFAALTAALAVTMVWAAGGLSFLGPGSSETATPELVFRQIASRVVQSDGMKLLVISGQVENQTQETRKVPVIRIDLRPDGGATQTTLIEPLKDRLAPGQVAGFTVRLSHAGGKIPQIDLSFSPQAGMTGGL